MKTLPLAALLLLAVPLIARADAREEAEIFRAADQAREQAEALEAALLAPLAYGAATATLEAARRDYRGGEELGAVQAAAATARDGFAGAATAAKQARITLQQPLERREAAREAEAFRLAGGSWVKAEEQLRTAGRRLEKTDVAAALEHAARAAELYDQAELLAIKAAVLGEARSRVAGLDGAGTARLAPRTTARAGELLDQAERTLDAQRSAVGPAGELAAAAAAAADHAVAMARLLREAREQDRSPEDLVLEWEAGLTQAATAAGGTLDLSGGAAAASAALAADVAALRQRTDQQAEELRQRDRLVAALEEEIRDLDARLAGATTQARSLTERLDTRERAIEQFTRLEGLFAADEAQVLRQGKDIIVRVQGLAFASGSARLPASAGPLLTKLRDAVALYPRARYAVEGHTDASGDSAANQRLSQARANAVRDYMLGTLQLPAGRVSAIGYGDSRPVASNATTEGRRQNRRIDLVITPPQAPGS